MKTKNRKKHPIKLFRGQESHQKAETVETLREKEYQINAQIHSLEEVLASLEAKEVDQQRMRNENVMPPPEQRWSGHHRSFPSTAQQRRKKREQFSSALRFFVLLLVAGLLAYWLFRP